MKKTETEKNPELARKIYGYCNELRNFQLQNEFFAEWFLRSFQDPITRSDESYIKEWIGRFMKGTPYMYMDGERLEIYIELVEDW